MNHISVFQVFGCFFMLILFSMLVFFLLPVLIPAILLLLLLIIFHRAYIVHAVRGNEKKAESDDVIDVEVLQAESHEAEPNTNDNHRLQ